MDTFYYYILLGITIPILCTATSYARCYKHQILEKAKKENCIVCNMDQP